MKYILVSFNANGVVDSTIVILEEGKFPSRTFLKNSVLNVLTTNVPGFNRNFARVVILSFTIMTEEEYEQFNQ